MSTHPEITAGELVAIKLKELFFKDTPWNPKIASQVGARLALLKELAKPFYPEMDMVQMLHTLARYSQGDLLDAFEGSTAKEGSKPCLNQPNAIGAHLERSMETL